MIKYNANVWIVLNYFSYTLIIIYTHIKHSNTSSVPSHLPYYDGWMWAVGNNNRNNIIFLTILYYHTNKVMS